MLPDRLKILAVATEWDSGHGGISTFNRELCRALAKVGHDVYCAVPQLEPNEVARAKADGVTLVAPKQLPGPADQDELYRKLEGLPADVHVLIGHARITGKYALAQLTDHRPEAQYVHFLHMDPRLIEPLKPGERANKTQTAEDRANLEVGLGTSASVVVAVGPELTRSFTFYFHGRGGVVHEFLPGLFQSDWGAPPPDGQCLVFGRAEDEELKGIDLAADSMRIVCEDEGFDLTRLVVRGAPADEGDDLQKRLSKKTEGRPRVDVRPYTSDREQVLAEVRASGLVLMLSREEGFGLTGLEAISQGIPVLVSKTSGLGQALLRELPEHAKHCVVDVRRGTKEIAPRISAILLDPKAAYQRSAELRRAMGECFCWERSARTLVELIRNRGKPNKPPSTPTPRTKSSDGAGTSAIDALKAASEPVLAWQQTLHKTGDWIERPELELVLLHARGSSQKPLVLLGPPGSGKSALLSRAALRILDENVAVLAIKADRLPVNVDTREALATELGLPIDVVEALRAASQIRKTVLFVDQLDALADLADLKTGRLSLLLDLIAEVVAIGSIQVVLSCRTFEFSHDVRLTRLGAEEMRLAPPSNAEVDRALTNANVVPSSIAPRVKESLQTVQVLDVFLQVAPAERNALGQSHQKLLEALWVQRLASGPDPSALESAAEQIAALMADREELWITRAVLTANRLETHLQELLATGLLVEEGERFAFAHQVLFDFARARSFLATQSLAAYVLEKRQDALFVRPTLWTSLAYLRALDPAKYFTALEELWRAEKLRRHIRTLIIDFLGQAADPQPREIVVLGEALDSDEWAGHALSAIAGRRRWFELLRDARFPGLMRGELAGWMVEVLAHALFYAAEEVADLIERTWLMDPAKHSFIASVITKADRWIPRMESIATAMVRGGGLELPFVEALINSAVSAAPDVAPKLIAAELVRQRDQIDAENKEAFEQLLERAGGLNSVREAAEASPAAFAEAVWPVFVDLLQRVASGTRSDQYDEDYSFATTFEYGVRDLPDAMRTALTACATKEPTFVSNLLEKWQHLTSIGVHRMLTLTLGETLPATKDAAIGYILGDPRRLVVGTPSEPDSFTVNLLRALAPLLTSEEVERVRELIANSRRIDPALLPARKRQVAYDANRKHRLRLLLALGKDRISAVARKDIEVEERRFPNVMQSSGIEGGLIGSPVQTAQMLRSRDEDILRLFAELPDETGHRHPVRDFEGGSTQASQAFGEAAKHDPERFLVLLSSFKPGVNERPVGWALRKLAEVLPLERIERAVLELYAIGFFNQHDGQDDAAYALERAASEHTGMSESILGLLKSWLTDYEGEMEPIERTAPDTTRTSILFGHGGGGILPGGNFPILYALTRAYLDQSPPDYDAWVRVLEEHVERREDPDTWRALGRFLPMVLNVEATRAERLLDRVFRDYAVVRDSHSGVLIIARAMHRLQANTIGRWIASIEKGDWSRKHQAVGELLHTFATKRGAPTSVGDRVEQSLAEFEKGQGTPDLILGIAHAAASLWLQPERRAAASSVLVRLIPKATEVDGLPEALMAAFHDGFLEWDAETRAVLAALTRTPKVIVSGKSFGFLESLRGLLPIGGASIVELLLALTNHLITVNERGYVMSHDAELVDIAMTLQRLGSPIRELGLDVFERLLMLNAFEARSVLAELDPSEPRQGLRTRRAPRKPRGRRRN